MSSLNFPGKSRRFLAPALIFALALVVRAFGLTWGLPNAERFYSYHPDESVNQIVGAVVHLLQGDFNPHFFNYPSLSIYATWIIYQFLAVFGLTTNVPDAAYPWPIIRDIIFAGRLFSVATGAATAALTWGIARQLGLNRGAIVAGILVALLPGLVQHSHYATVDIPATFFVALCVWLSLRARTNRALLVAALVAGLAAGTKYNAGLVVVVPMACALLLPELKNRWTSIILAPIVALLGFIVSTPYALLSPAEFWGDPSKQMGFAYELLVHPREGSGDIFTDTGNGWWYHLTFNLPFVMTAPLAVAAVVGAIFAAREKRFWPIILFVGLFFLSLGFSQVRFMRYLFPIAPLLCVTAVWAASRLPKPSVWGFCLALLVTAATPGILWPFQASDSRDIVGGVSRSWRGKEAMGLVNNPWFYTPPFQPMGVNIPIEGTVVTGFDVAKMRASKARLFAISEFEYREQLRLHPNGEAAKFLEALPEFFNGKHWFYGKSYTHSIALPGRKFVPHDYLYNSPDTRLYSQFY